jgi:hypothetical protein
MLRQQETNYVMLAIMLAFGVFLVAGLVVVPTIEEVQAKGPPAKAQAILAAEPRERGTVASGGQGGGCNSCG